MNKSFIPDPDSVDSLETFLIQTAAASVSVRTLLRIQNTAISRGILDNDETEACKTVIYQLSRTLGALNDLAVMCQRRMPDNWTITMINKMGAKVKPKKTRKKS